MIVNLRLAPTRCLKSSWCFCWASSSGCTHHNYDDHADDHDDYDDDHDDYDPTRPKKTFRNYIFKSNYFISCCTGWRDCSLEGGIELPWYCCHVNWLEGHTRNTQMNGSRNLPKGSGSNWKRQKSENGHEIDPKKQWLWQNSKAKEPGENIPQVKNWKTTGIWLNLPVSCPFLISV